MCGLSEGKCVRGFKGTDPWREPIFGWGYKRACARCLQRRAGMMHLGGRACAEVGFCYVGHLILWRPAHKGC